MRKVLSAAAALGVCLALPAAAMAGAGVTDEQILKDLEYLRNKVAAQQEHIEALEGKQDSKGKVALANEFIDQLTLKGDLRVRYEKRDKDYKDGQGSDASRDRWRTRFRLGGIWDNKAENWQVGAGLATGSDDPTSTNDTWSESKTFETGDIRLDYAYAKHKWNDFAFTLGQAENPYKSSWVFWDGDVRLSGLTAQYGQKDGIFATLGGYGAKLVNDDNTATLVAGQAGYKGKVGSAKYTLAAGYQTYSKSLINEGNAAFELDRVDEDKYELNIGDLYGDVSFPVGDVKLKLYGQIWQNFGADGEIGESQAEDFTKKPGDADMGWVFGADAKYNSFKLGYAYSVVEADSLFGYLSDSDFGDGLNASKTNKKGHRVQLGYDISKNWGTSLTWLSFEPNEESVNYTVDQVDIYQFDVSYKF
ncbi:putative porin [Thiovibrio frasassiensis]|uniref:Porin n=1 Tax=Thiovibrio frasassiensis TaxID=2984131 RepID=A0A9X4RLJ5_9BACT|nr:putative porin [Thiovibrio frasassiensis]MDG4476196.1 putative porin [Thiovibrio frasassiensis]